MNKIILPSDTEAATFKTNICGWVSRSGLFFREHKDAEKLARYEGATHVPCNDCGAVARKPALVCPECEVKREKKRYLKRKRVAWDGNFPLYSEYCDIWFWSYDEIAEHLEDTEIKDVDDLQLVPCNPVTLKEIDEGYWDEDLTEDGELPKKFVRALQALNKLAHETVVSWEPNKYRVNILL